MLRLRSSILAGLLSYSAAFPTPFPLHRLLSAAPAVSPNPSFAFGVEDYLVATCGLTRAQALKASTKLSHLKSPTKPDAVLAFLARRGLSAAGVAKDLSLLGSYSNLLRGLKCNSGFLAQCPERLGMPNVTLLRDCGLGACDIAKLCVHVPWLLTTNLDKVQAMVARAEETLGVPRGSGMFRQALQAVAFLSEEKIAARVEYLKNAFRWSDAEARIAVCKFPRVLTLSEDNLRRKSEFLVSEAELESSYVAHCPQLISYSLEGRLKPPLLRCQVSQGKWIARS